ncbi:hypothetical protein D3C85_1210590 [compost metagenome]
MTFFRDRLHDIRIILTNTAKCKKGRFTSRIATHLQQGIHVRSEAGAFAAVRAQIVIVRVKPFLNIEGEDVGHRRQRVSHAS